MGLRLKAFHVLFLQILEIKRSKLDFYFMLSSSMLFVTVFLLAFSRPLATLYEP